jgi:hypothetical protein
MGQADRFEPIEGEQFTKSPAEAARGSPVAGGPFRDRRCGGSLIHG